MPSVAVITEYNPFHFGHFYQLTELKKHFDTVVCIMSGFAVQRGGVAVADKYTRARAAVDCGASLVLELPFPYSCASARDFAAAGVDIASRICVDSLAFGAEDDIQPLIEVSRLRESGILQQKTEHYLAAGVRSYPLALCEAVRECVGDKAAEMLKKPNNILAAEYIYYAGGCGLDVYPIRRDMSYKSATELRSLGENMLCELPQKSAHAFESGSSLDSERLDVFVLSRLYDKLGHVGRDDVYSATDDALCRLRTHASEHTSLESLAKSCADGSHTTAYYRRLICSIAFGVTPVMPKSHINETLLLAADDDGRRHLNLISKANKISVTTKPSAAADEGLIKALETESAVSRICMRPPFDPFRSRPYIR